MVFFYLASFEFLFISLRSKNANILLSLIWRSTRKLKKRLMESDKDRFYRQWSSSFETVNFELNPIWSFFFAFCSDVGHVLALEITVKCILLHANIWRFFPFLFAALWSASNGRISWEHDALLSVFLALIQLSIDAVKNVHTCGAAVFAFECNFLYPFEVRMIFDDSSRKICQFARFRSKSWNN